MSRPCDVGHGKCPEDCTDREECENATAFLEAIIADEPHTKEEVHELH
jgi:hypothetical protein